MESGMQGQLTDAFKLENSGTLIIHGPVEVVGEPTE